MIKEFIAQAEISTTFEVECFGGALWVGGNVLSPVDAQAVGLASSLLSVNLTGSTTDSTIQKLAAFSERLSQGREDMPAEDLEEAVRQLGSINTDKLKLIGENQSKVICQVVKRASRDGTTWEPINLVMQQEHQSSEHSRLWVGVLAPEDRLKIIDRALNGHQEAAELLSNFC